MLVKLDEKESGLDVYILKDSKLNVYDLTTLYNCIIYLTEKQFNEFESLNNGCSCISVYKEAFRRNIDIKIKKEKCQLNS